MPQCGHNAVAGEFAAALATAFGNNVTCEFAAALSTAIDRPQHLQWLCIKSQDVGSHKSEHNANAATAATAWPQRGHTADAARPHHASTTSSQHKQKLNDEGSSLGCHPVLPMMQTALRATKKLTSRTRIAMRTQSLDTAVPAHTGTESFDARREHWLASAMRRNATALQTWPNATHVADFCHRIVRSELPFAKWNTGPQGPSPEAL